MCQLSIKEALIDLKDNLDKLIRHKLLIEKGLLNHHLTCEDMEYIDTLLKCYITNFECDIDNINALVSKIKCLIG